MIDHDRLFKELLTTFFVDFVELFIPEIAAILDRSSIRFLDKEVFTDVTSGDKHTADLVVEARLFGQEEGISFLFHIESQGTPEFEFDRRMFKYFARLYEKYKRPVYPIAIFTYKSPARPEVDHHTVEFPGLTVLRFQYKVIQLGRLRWRDFLDKRNPIAAAFMSAMNIAPEDRARVKVECLRLIATLKLDPARMRLISGFVDTYLKLNKQEEAVFQQEVKDLKLEEEEGVMEIVTSWMEEGIQKGLELGRQEGRQEGDLAIVLRLLRRRLGAIPEESAARLRALPVESLETLSEDLLDFQDREDLDTWLAKAIGNPS